MVLVKAMVEVARQDEVGRLVLNYYYWVMVVLVHDWQLKLKEDWLSHWLSHDYLCLFELMYDLVVPGVVQLVVLEVVRVVVLPHLVEQAVMEGVHLVLVAWLVQLEELQEQREQMHYA